MRRGFFCTFSVLLVLIFRLDRVRAVRDGVGGRTVRDSSGAVVPDAKVTLTNTETASPADRPHVGRQLRVLQRQAGHLPGAPRKSGFSIALMDNVQVQVRRRMRVDMQMAVGQLTEKVESRRRRRSSKPTRASAAR
jgi:hypothetical protein